MRTRIIFSVVALTAVIITTIVAGCSFDKWVEVAEGDYIPINTEIREHDDSVISIIESMTIDRGKNTIEVRLRDGDMINTTFTPRPKKEWPSGCPANIGSTRMEVLDLEVDQIAIGHMVIENPILVRNCPQNPERIVLRGDGQIGGSGTACAENNKCIHFKPGSPTEPLKTPVKLTEEEKDMVIQIAIDSSEVTTLLEEGGTFKTELRWVAILTKKHGSGFYQIEYDWQTDDNFKNVPEEAVWYPGVLIRFGEPEKWQVLVAVDLDAERTVFVQQNPYRSGPDTLHEDPDIVGLISDIQASSTSNTSGRILVELEQSDNTSDKYWVGIKPDTITNDYRGGTHARAIFTDFEVGQQVQVWFGGPVRESYPAQVDAKRIDITT